MMLRATRHKATGSKLADEFGFMHRVFCITGLSVALFGCPASNEDVQPPSDQIYFPTGLAALPDESALFVANANLRSALRIGFHRRARHGPSR